jgi:three-Cys-motif partner protein
MATVHEFGGDWTSEKLQRIRKYLQAYTKIFSANPRAQKLHTIYLDAFAGTGYRNSPRSKADSILFLEGFEEDNQAFLKGSARIALEVEPPFKEYVFIERDQEYANELNKLKAEYISQRNRITVVNQDANSYLIDWAKRTKWNTSRAVVFLDPYGMEVEWSAIETLGNTQAVDLWILFPLGVAVNRLLTRSAPPPEGWAHALTRIFGTDTWRDAFYPRQKVYTLFGEEEVQQKDADFDRIGKFFTDRLKTAFTRVSMRPLALKNSKNNPLYLLCFASANPRGAPTAIKIADHILEQ